MTQDKYTLTTHKNYSFVNIVTIPKDNIKKIDFALCKQPTEIPDDYYKRQVIKPDIITNGGFFSMSDGQTCFGFRDDNKSIALADYLGVGIVDDKTLVFGHNRTTTTLRDFISAYPVLVANGYKADFTYALEINYNARRTAFGWNKDNVYIVTVDNPGLKFSPLADIFLELKCDHAINLDGGGSTRMLIEGARKTKQVYARPVDNVLCIYLNKEEERKVLYKVQVGAFKNKDNADKLMEELKINGFSDAYIRYYNSYYKVQLGAFSVKLNAERLSDRLKAAGYRTMIVEEMA